MTGNAAQGAASEEVRSEGTHQMCVAASAAALLWTDTHLTDQDTTRFDVRALVSLAWPLVAQMNPWAESEKMQVRSLTTSPATRVPAGEEEALGRHRRRAFKKDEAG